MPTATAKMLKRINSAGSTSVLPAAPPRVQMISVPAVELNQLYDDARRLKAARKAIAAWADDERDNGHPWVAIELLQSIDPVPLE